MRFWPARHCARLHDPHRGVTQLRRLADLGYRHEHFTQLGSDVQRT
ncbi:hypothetical protein RBS60_08960 [Sinomonas sp. ASV486]|uniref:Uncharacterized protein n=1 Tax=Sinomonas puerhi TaxID=3238584 RepID=A0AB39L631_9MICC|nr:hypothetical protein [Sinomonas sp. ASV486]MDQ4490329.1 hypothetical protein [Sinomonas sp. ASV486]